VFDEAPNCVRALAILRFQQEMRAVDHVDLQPLAASAGARFCASPARI